MAEGVVMNFKTSPLHWATMGHNSHELGCPITQWAIGYWIKQWAMSYLVILDGEEQKGGVHYFENQTGPAG